MGGSSSSTTQRYIPPESWWEEYTKYVLLNDALQGNYRQNYYQNQADSIMGYGSNNLSDQMSGYLSGNQGIGNWWEQYGLTSNPLSQYMDIVNYIENNQHGTSTPLSILLTMNDRSRDLYGTGNADARNRADVEGMSSIMDSSWDPLGNLMSEFETGIGAKINNMLGGSIPVQSGWTAHDSERTANTPGLSGMARTAANYSGELAGRAMTASQLNSMLDSYDGITGGGSQGSRAYGTSEGDNSGHTSERNSREARTGGNGGDGGDEHSSDDGGDEHSSDGEDTQDKV